MKVRFVEKILEKVGMEAGGRIREVLPADTPVGKTIKYSMFLDSYFILTLYQGRWEDSRQRTNCRICSTHVKLPERVAGKEVEIQFTYDSNCLIDIQVVFEGEVVEHLKVKDKWNNDRTDHPLCVAGESDQLRKDRRRRELVLRCEDLQEKLRNNSSPDFEAVGTLRNKINIAPKIGELNSYGLELAEIEKRH